MRDSPEDEPTIIEVLCAFIRTNAPTPAKAAKPSEIPAAPEDVRAAVTVLGRRPHPEQDQNRRLDFTGTQLSLSGISLSRANLSGAALVEAHLVSANLSGADLSRALLSRADLSWTDLRGANLRGANLNDARLDHARLDGADLNRTDLIAVDLRKVRGLTSEALRPLLALGSVTPVD
ncbi:pentapeptide repeat-containing protein [Micromonospora sp. NPDC047620]|uniref:pentapeptide repeat-containing protein n=1 Tax=Micromonospora sp. NPDC047620 TaxID=3364251 RepID=UPI00371D8CDD